MTTARSNQIDLSITPYYHCMTRCVRQSYLCGYDSKTGKNYSHRKPWIVKRIKKLARVFAIHVCAFAVMSNHYHLVLFINAAKAKHWSDDEVQARWAQLFPHDAKSLNTYSKKEAEYKIILWRHRLMDISWFMRCLNEKIARASNKEDETKGRFWEGRFKSQALLDEGAVLSAMAYVDLNPIRAKIAETPEESAFTSIQERIQMLTEQLKKNISIEHAVQPPYLMPFASKHITENDKTNVIDFTLTDYLQLIDTTGRILREDKRGAIPSNLIPILARLHLNANEWLNLVTKLQNQFSYAIGHSAALLEFNRGNHHQSPKGMTAARHYYIDVA